MQIYTSMSISEIVPYYTRSARMCTFVSYECTNFHSLFIMYNNY